MQRHRFALRFFIIAALLFSPLVVVSGMPDASGDYLSFIEAHYDDLGLDTVFSVVVSPDGKNVYTASTGDDALAVFHRNTTTGKLVWVEMHVDGVDGVEGLEYLTVVGCNSVG